MFVNKRQQLPQPKRLNFTGRGVSLGKPVHDRTAQQSVGKKNGVSAVAQLTQKKDAKKTLDWDDISLSSDDSKSFERFLKKPTGISNPPNIDIEKKSDQESLQTPSYERPKTSRGGPSIYSTNITHKSSSSAVDRLASLEARLKDRKDRHSLNKVSLSTSDFDVNVSSDSEIKRTIGKPGIKLREKVKKSSSKKAFSGKSDHVFLSMLGESSSEEEAGTRNKFIKADVALTYSDAESQDSGPDVKLLSSSKTDSKSQILRRNADLDGNKPSQQRFRAGLNEADITKAYPSKKVTFASDLERSSDVEQSLDDFLPPSEISESVGSLDEVLPTKLHNIMSLDDLMPSINIKDEISDEPANSVLDFPGLHSVDELLPVSDIRSSSEFAVSMEEDIQADESQKSSYSDDKGILTNLRSIEDLHIDSGSDSKKPTRSLSFAEALEESQAEEIKTESVHYSEDFHSDDDTLKETESISKDIVSPSVSSLTSSVQEESSRGGDKREKDASFYSFSHSSSISTPPPKKVERKRTKKVASMQTQTDISPGAWVPGSVYADRTSFRPTKLVDNEALDVLTSYNPATLAIQDLLRQQVHLTREFVSRSRRLHELAVASIPCDYTYGEVDRESLDRLKTIMDTQRDRTVSAT